MDHTEDVCTAAFASSDAIFESEGQECSEQFTNFLANALKVSVGRASRSTTGQGCHSTASLVQVYARSDDAEPFIKLWWKVARSKSGSSFEVVRDVRSYANEAYFYTAYAEKLQECGLKVPSCRGLAVSPLPKEHEGCDVEELKKVCYALALQDMTGFSPPPSAFLEEEKILACLGWLARLHAAFWGNEVHGLWPTGTWWSKDKQQLGHGLIESAWRRRLDAMGEKLHGFQELGSDLQKVQEIITETLGKSTTPRALLHGDVKASNMLFAEKPDGITVNDVALIDWQWSGAGLAVCDLADFLASTFKNMADLMANGAALEHRWLSFYCQQLANAGVHYPLFRAIQEFRLASLELGGMYCIWWWNCSAADDPESENVLRMLSHIHYVDACLKHVLAPPSPEMSPVQPDPSSILSLSRELRSPSGKRRDAKRRRVATRCVTEVYVQKRLCGIQRRSCATKIAKAGA